MSTLDEAGMRVAAGWARRHLAEALLEVGDRDAAAAELRLAASLAAAEGANRLEAAISDLRRRGRLGVAAAGHIGLAAGLTDREREVVRLVAAGLTNAEIGDRLFISAKTASVHVSNVMRKLGVTNRRQVARAARECGLLAADGATGEGARGNVG